MGGKATVIELNADMTFRERKRKTEENHIKVSKNKSPSFVIGRSIFRELIPFWKKVLLFKRSRNLILYFTGANSCFSVSKQSLNSYESQLWSEKEKEDYVNKLIAKSRAELKPMSNFQFFIIGGLLVAILLIEIFRTLGAPISV